MASLSMVAVLELLAVVLSIVGTVLVVGALIALLRVSGWNSDRFQVALRENRRITAAGLFGFGLEVASVLMGLLA